ncbi:radical SAM protein, partial [uncultured Campylobacter sp.]|uniref:radical SAM protein n=1 Tax=uncultured Campylobacter sp. TaxID=218934 RepID=UPI00261B92E1
MKIYFKTFGCRTNIYDTQLIKSNLKSGEITHDEQGADVVVINSCTVTNGADADVRNYVNKMNRLGKKILLTGCGAVSRGEELYKNGAVFGVFGMSQKEKIDEFLGSESKFYDIGGLDGVEKNLISDYEDHTKAFIKIQEGCDFNCSYCIIPSVRGRSRSSSEDAILKEAESLAANGFSEIVLTGTNIGSYGRTAGTSLG